MKLEDLPERLRNPPVINPAYVEALEQRLAYAKELLKESPSYINKEWDKEVKAFIEKLSQEGL